MSSFCFYYYDYYYYYYFIFFGVEWWGSWKHWGIFSCSINPLLLLCLNSIWLVNINNIFMSVSCYFSFEWSNWKTDFPCVLIYEECHRAYIWNNLKFRVSKRQKRKILKKLIARIPFFFFFLRNNMLVLTRLKLSFSVNSKCWH